MVYAQSRPVGIPEDWSHHHVVFSNPGNLDDAAPIKLDDAKRSANLERWSRVTSDERYQMQLLRNTPRVRRPLKPFRTGGASRQGLKKDWSMYMGSGATVGADQYPAKFTFDTTTASCSDFVVYNTSLAGGGSGGQANIVAYSNLYEYSSSDSSGCSGTVPAVYWAYSSGAGQAMTSTVLSADGTKVAYVENNATSGAVLRILQWAAREGNPLAAAVPRNPYTNSHVGAAGNTAWSSCPSGQSCLISVPFQNSAQDTISAPFYVYSSADTIYVGDASGYLHQFTGVFNGTPAEVTTGGWPIAVSGNVLTSPVYDSGGSGNVFVADSGGYLYSFNGVNATSEMTSSKLTAAGNTTGIVDAPLLDPSTEKVYVFVGDDANTAGFELLCPSPTGCDGVFQFSATNNIRGSGSCDATSEYSWGTGTNCGEEAVLGNVGTTAVYDGAFDHIYQVGNGTTGNLWSCAPVFDSGPGLDYVTIGLDGGITPEGTSIGIATDTMAHLASGPVTCSPITENWGSDGTTNDYIFLSLSANANVYLCYGASLCNFVVGTGGTATTPGTMSERDVANGGIATAGGSSGIIIDNNLGNSSNTYSQVYYTPLADQSCGGNGSTGSGTGGCAVQVSQTNP
jgi:hypothetical protein